MIPVALWIDNGTGPFQNPDITQAEFDAGIAQMTANNVKALWETAHDYEYQEISGSAVGMLALGVAQKLPVSLAISAWIQSIWSLYYTRKPTVTHVWDQSLLDFTSCGPIPHDIPTLIAEVTAAIPRA